MIGVTRRFLHALNCAQMVKPRHAHSLHKGVGMAQRMKQIIKSLHMADLILTRCLQAEDLVMCCRCTFVSATSIFFNVVPVIRIVYGVFPFNPNRWFGIGFLVYYCCFTPLLYQVSPLGP